VTNACVSRIAYVLENINQLQRQSRTKNADHVSECVLLNYKCLKDSIHAQILLSGLTRKFPF
jgi:hypothetical protein